jgi:Zn-finger protein
MMANLCEKYPCHDGIVNEFSCDFCYCPLYFIDCEVYGGSPKFIKSLRDSRIKDCVDCLLPHTSDFMKDKNRREKILELIKSR